MLSVPDRIHGSLWRRNGGAEGVPMHEYRPNDYSKNSGRRSDAVMPECFGTSGIRCSCDALVGG